jgi:hypothetical protein
MKALNMILLTTLLSLPLLVAAGPREGGDDDSRNSSSVYVLKADKKFIGAKVEIFTSGGQLITAQTVDKKKMLIDFGDVKIGVYTIKLTSGGDTQSFTFEKK